MNTLNELGRVAAETEAALKRWLTTDSILHRWLYEGWYCRLGEIAFDSSRLEVKSLPALWDMHMLAVDGPVATIFRYIYRHYRSDHIMQRAAPVLLPDSL